MAQSYRKKPFLDILHNETSINFYSHYTVLHIEFFKIYGDSEI